MKKGFWENLWAEMKKDDLNKHEDTIINLIDSFRKMCDYIEQNDNIGCSKCPVYNDCFNNHKHDNLHLLMEGLGIKKT